MCIIAVLPKGVAPDYKRLQNCFDYNNHGAGFAYQTEKGVMIEKGFFNFDKLYGHLCNVGNDVDRVVHFRLATSGLVDQGNCHPFPVTKSFECMRKPRFHTDIAIAHNGIISKCTPPQKSIQSDTMQFIRDYVYPLPRDFYDNRAICDMIDWASANKFAILYKDGFRLIGTFNQKDGVFYSNYTWEDSAISYAGYTTGSHSTKYIKFDISGLSDDKYSDIIDKIINALDDEHASVVDFYYDDTTLWVEVVWYPLKREYYGMTWKVDHTMNEIAKAQTAKYREAIADEIVDGLITNGTAKQIILLNDKGEAIEEPIANSG